MLKSCSRRISANGAKIGRTLPLSEAFRVSTRTVERVRERFVQKGLETALNRAKPSRFRNRVIDNGENEAHLIALTCGNASDGRSRCSLGLLGQRMVELGYV